GFSDALGVHCDYCHAKSSDPNQKWPDFASDAKPEKNIARKMMKMTAKINKKFFSFNKDEQGNVQDAISCGICHHGSPHPEFKAPPHEERQGPPPPSNN
ncbi:MAG: c-type cytochrome, partial [Bacteroidetes bacterium]|nr:c-type cytochrome [Bacteroidota bacterium]